MQVKDHKLQGESITFKESPNQGTRFEGELPDTIIMHYTAGSSLSGAVNTLSKPENEVSAHIVIGRDGSIVQLVPFDTIAFHAGPSNWEDRTGLNKYSIGIEMDNAGKLEEVGNGYQAWFGTTYSEKNVIKAVHRNQEVERYWHTYTEEQISKAYEICELLIPTYNIKKILGHEEISPGRKEDPGPAFPLDKFRERLLNSDGAKDEGEPEPEKGEVTASSLNIRASPDTDAQKIADPLPDGKEVKIVEQKGGWYRVRTPIEGWVHGDYIKRK